jgi:hypothetical protein
VGSASRILAGRWLYQSLEVLFSEWVERVSNVGCPLVSLGLVMYLVFIVDVALTSFVFE